MTIFFRKTRPAWSVTRISSRSTWVATRGVRGVDFACLGWHLLDLDVRGHDELAAGTARPAALGAEKTWRLMLTTCTRARHQSALATAYPIGSG
jgi:hypothetical protein